MVHHSSSTLCSVGGCGSTWGSESLYVMNTLQQTALGKETCLSKGKDTLQQGWRSWAPALSGERRDCVFPVLCSAKLILQILL